MGSVFTDPNLKGEKMYYEKIVDEKSYYLFYFGRYDDSTEPHFTPPHCHDAYELLVVTQGSVDAVLNGETITLKAGDILFADSYDVHSFVFENCERYSLVFSKDHCRMLADGEKTLPSCPSCDEKSFKAILSRLEEYNSLYGREIPNGLLVESLVSYILGIIESSCGRVERRVRTNELMISVLDYINKNSDKDLTLTSVASKFGYAPSYFSAIFNKFVNMSFTNYLSYVRYTHAAEIILLQGCTATDIAMKCGFGSMNSFYRAKNKFDKKQNNKK